MNGILRKLSITLMVLTVIVIVVAFAGKRMIESSPVYQASSLELQRRYGISPADLSVRFFAPFKFSEGDLSGFAEFSLCDKNDCYEVEAHKNAGVWEVSTARK